jgi:hypothetical protein
MAADRTVDRRVKFYGVHDLGSHWPAQRAATILEHFDSTATARTIADVIELHNAQLFAANGLFPDAYSDEQQAAARVRVPAVRGAVGKFFNALNEDNLAAQVGDVGYQYHADLLELFARFKVYDRCSPAAVLQVLDQARIHLGEMLAQPDLVRACDAELRARLIADPANADQLLRKYLEKDIRRAVQLPASLTTADARALLDAFLDSDDASPNWVELIATAPLNKHQALGLDAKLKLKAKRKHDRWTEDFFKENTGITTGCEVAITDEQTEPVEASSDGLVSKFSYSRQWLEDGLDYPTILNNFIYLFEFADRHMLLTLPSFEAQRGVFERFMGVAGRDAYPIGAAFRFKDQAALVQTVLYHHFLRSQQNELETVVAWFFTDYLPEHFGAANLRFVPTSQAASYLEKSRHLFVEMESVVKQFALYVENGELDTELLAIASDQISYKAIPSLLDGKYVYASDDRDIQQVLYLLFSDQSGLAYINEELRADDAASLLIANQVAYSDFEEYQRRQVDYLIKQGVWTDTGERVHFTSPYQFRVLRDLFHTEAASYYHYPAEARALTDAMLAKGWLVRRSTLLTDAEGSYFNYSLNQSEFSNGPDLRNRYLHGSHIDVSDEDEHFRTYVTALKLLIALVIKINDDFWLQADETSADPASEAESVGTY